MYECERVYFFFYLDSLYHQQYRCMFLIKTVGVTLQDTVIRLHGTKRQMSIDEANTHIQKKGYRNSLRILIQLFTSNNRFMLNNGPFSLSIRWHLSTSAFNYGLVCQSQNLLSPFFLCVCVFRSIQTMVTIEWLSITVDDFQYSELVMKCVLEEITEAPTNTSIASIFAMLQTWNKFHHTLCLCVSVYKWMYCTHFLTQSIQRLSVRYTLS